MKVRISTLLFAFLIFAVAGPPHRAQTRRGRSRPPARANRMPAEQKSVLIPNRSPLVSFRILFMTGSAADPKGKEGLASLTAAMLAEGGTRTKTYAQLNEA